MSINLLEYTKKHLETFSKKNPARSYGVQLEHKYMLSLDYLVLNYTGEPSFSSHLLGFEHFPNGGRNFSKRVKVSYSGMDFCTIIYAPYSKVINEELCQIQLSNQLFYMFSLEKLRTLLDRVMSLMNLDFDKFNRIDTALDFEGDAHSIEPVIAFVDMGALRVSGRQKQMNFYNSTRNGQVKREGVQIGKRDSYRFLRIYNKTLEMEGNYKTYVKTRWDEVGFKGDVWRYEFQLNAKYLRDVEGITLDTVFSKQGLFDLLEMANKNFFELRYNTGKTETNKEKPFDLFDWDMIKKVVKVVSNSLKRLKRTVKETLIGQQRMIKGLLRSYVSTGQRIEYILPLKIILGDYDLWEWFGKKLPFYLHEFNNLGFVKNFDRALFNEDILTEI